MVYYAPAASTPSEDDDSKTLQEGLGLLSFLHLINWNVDVMTGASAARWTMRTRTYYRDGRLKNWKGS